MLERAREVKGTDPAALAAQFNIALQGTQASGDALACLRP